MTSPFAPGFSASRVSNEFIGLVTAFLDRVGLVSFYLDGFFAPWPPLSWVHRQADSILTFQE